MIKFYDYDLKQWTKFFALSKTFSNPIKKLSPAHFIFEAMQDLGANKYHSISHIADEFRNVSASICKKDGQSFLSSYDAAVGKKNKFDSMEALINNRLAAMTRPQNQIYKRLRSQQSAIEKRKINGKIYYQLNTKLNNGSDSTGFTVMSNQQRTSMKKSFLFIKISFTNIYKWLLRLCSSRKGHK